MCIRTASVQHVISIHALREEGDAAARTNSSSATYFYPRPPRGGRRPRRSGSDPGIRFLSTPSARRATMTVEEFLAYFQISIHALREEGDFLQVSSFEPTLYFYPRPPRGGRLPICGRLLPPAEISIHALREEGDLPVTFVVPCQLQFLSTPSARRATLFVQIHDQHPPDFYPRPPRGGRPTSPSCGMTARNFYPRPPRGGRLLLRAREAHKGAFLSTPSARRATERVDFPVAGDADFYPRPPRGGRPLLSKILPKLSIFLSTPSARRAT